MAELTFKSAGVSHREIDLTGPTAVVPQGVPAAVIGTSDKGPAFVPVVFATYQDFVARFGPSDGKKFGPLAVSEWMKNSRSGLYMRILGVGNGKQRVTADEGDTRAGGVLNAGYVVGNEGVQANGFVGANAYVGSTTATPTGIAQFGLGHLGRTYVLGCFMSESAGSSLFHDADIIPGGDQNGNVSSAALAANTMVSSSVPILRAVMMAPSGVLLGLSSSWADNNSPLPDSAAFPNFGSTAGASAGRNIGSVDLQNSKQEFVLLCNGLKETSDAKPNVLTASFDPNAQNYFPNVFNTDASRIEQYGHYLHSWYNVYPSYAVPTGSGVVSISAAGRQTNPDSTQVVEPIAFLLTSSVGRNTGTARIPNTDNWRNRYQHAESPWIISQEFGGKVNNLFRVHALDAGIAGSNKFKISIENIQASTNENDPYGSFDLLVRKFDDNDRNVVALEAFRKLSLSPGNDRYIARVVGDRNIYYDFEKKAGGQRLVAEGLHRNNSAYIRIEMASEVARGDAPDKSLPCGFRGPKHLITSGSDIYSPSGFTPLAGGVSDPVWRATGWTAAEADLIGGSVGQDIFNRITPPPIPMRQKITAGQTPKERLDADLYWGTQFEVDDLRIEPNKNESVDSQMKYFGSWYPNMATNTQHWWVGDNVGEADNGGTVYDSDRFCNNIFTLERVQIQTQSNDTPDPKLWDQARYRRNGVLDSSIASSRFLDPVKDFSSLSARRFLKFSFMVQGGYDGVDIFDAEKVDFSNVAVAREMDDTEAVPTGQGGTSGQVTAAYRKALDIIEEKSDCDIQLLVIPGQRDEGVTDYAIDTVEDRFDAMYIMDIEERDTLNNVVTSSNEQRISVSLTAESFASRNLDSSFAAAYFPDVVMTDPATQTNIQVPPSVAILGAYALNDAVAHPWYAPAGFTRGALKGILESQVKLNRDNLDALYEVDINPITAFPHSPGVVAFGQKTVLAAQSALDRVNVRRLLIEIRRRVRKLSRKVLFEPNREDTLAKFSASVQPVLARIQQQQGLDRFKVVIDTTTTTQADVENNTIRGKIFLQPTRALEFISLDFVITNAGAEI